MGGRLGLEEIDPSLSRRELQGLCKQHGLPANRSNTHLAKSLESLSKKTHFSSRPEGEGDSPAPSMLELKPKNHIKSPRGSVIDFRRAYVARKNSSVAGAYKKIACLKENKTKRKRELQAGNQSVTESLANGETSEFPCTSDTHKTMDSSQCPGSCHLDNSGKIIEPKQSSPSSTGGGICTSSSVVFRTNDNGQCSTERISSNVAAHQEIPAFQFFVASEGGVSLFVDLDSTPSDWIKSLKNEICLPQTLPHEIRHLGSINKRLNQSSAEFVMTSSLVKGSEGSSGCGNSPLSSVLTESHLSAAHPVDDDTPKSSVLTTNGSPAEPSFQLNELNQLAASNSLGYETPTCARDMEMLQDCNLGNSSVSKFSCNSQVDLDGDTSLNFDQLDHQVLETDSACPDTVEEGFSCHLSQRAAEKRSFSLSNERCEESKSLENCNQENHGELSRSSLPTCSKVMKPLNAAYRNPDKTPEAHVQQNLACSADNAEPALINHTLDQQSSYPVNPLPKMSSSTVDKKLETQNKLNKERSEQRQSNKLMLKTFRRTRRSGRRDVTQRRRPHDNSENVDSMVTSSRSSKTHLKDSSSKLRGVRRRSTRLMPKEP